MRVLRHASYATTLKHYTDLRHEDAAAAVDALPGIGGTKPAQHAEARETGS